MAALGLPSGCADVANEFCMFANFGNYWVVYQGPGLVAMTTGSGTGGFENPTLTRERDHVHLRGGWGGGEQRLCSGDW